jgi:hexokinase
MKSVLLEVVTRQFELPLSLLRAVRKAAVAEMDAGLAGRRSTIAMFPAYCDAASGREKGRYLALDLGGTNFRVMMVRLQGQGTLPRVVAEAKYRLTREQISGSGTVLFEAIAGYLHKFLKDQAFAGDYALGYTFSFPVRLLGIDEGVLVKWTKDFSATGVQGKKIVALQRRALARKGVGNVSIVALANDTVGTLQAEAALDPACVVGVILGTGFNMAVRVASRRIRKEIGLYSEPAMIINSESGGFGRSLSLTAYDRRVDRESGNVGHQFAEKMIAGKYLPQLVRALALEFIRKEHLFGGKVPPVFADKESFKGQYMDVFEAGSRDEVDKLSRELFGPTVTAQDCRIISSLCRIVSRRSARLAAAMIGAALSRSERRTGKRVTVAVDGSLFEKYPGYARCLGKAIRELQGRSVRVSLKLSKDGSGIGAAVIAAVVCSEQRRMG